MKFQKNHAIKLVCPFTPWVDAHGRSTTCLTDRCIQWSWVGNKKKTDPENMTRYGYCTLSNEGPDGQS